VLDWMAALRIPLVLVAGSYLGSLSHTLTGLDAIARRELILKAIVVNETPDSTVPFADTVATLSRFAGATAVIAIPRQPAAGAKPRALGELAALL
jgi:dethiobiotin synthetase